MQKGSTFKKFLHLNTVAFVKKGSQWAWKKTSKLFLIQFSTITKSFCSCFCCCCCCCCWYCFDFTRCCIKKYLWIQENTCELIFMGFADFNWKCENLFIEKMIGSTKISTYFVNFFSSLKMLTYFWKIKIFLISKLISNYFIFLSILSYCQIILKMSSTVKKSSCQIYELCLCAKIYFPRYAWKIHPRKYISTNEASFTVVVITLR